MREQETKDGVGGNACAAKRRGIRVECPTTRMVASEQECGEVDGWAEMQAVYVGEASLDAFLYIL